jgi:UPF0716 family protein affecting phage T7 exclusion
LVNGVLSLVNGVLSLVNGVLSLVNGALSLINGVQSLVNEALSFVIESLHDVHEQEDLSDEPRFLLADALHWESKQIIKTWTYRYWSNHDSSRAKKTHNNGFPIQFCLCPISMNIN